MLLALPVVLCSLRVLEFAIVGVFVLVGVDAGVVAGIAILDRTISYWRLMAMGAVVYVMSGRK